MFLIGRHGRRTADREHDNDTGFDYNRRTLFDHVLHFNEHHDNNNPRSC
jgi:hypothetical protein